MRRRLKLGVVLLIAVPVGAAAADSDLPWVNAEEMPVGAEEDLGGGFYRYGLLPEVETPDEVWDAGKLWAYVGQEVFSERLSCQNGREHFEWVDDLDESVAIPLDIG